MMWVVARTSVGARLLDGFCRDVLPVRQVASPVVHSFRMSLDPGREDRQARGCVIRLCENRSCPGLFRARTTNRAKRRKATTGSNRYRQGENASFSGYARPSDLDCRQEVTGWVPSGRLG